MVNPKSRSSVTALVSRSNRRTYSSAELSTVNDLTRLSSIPGYLNYEAYRQYLIRLGHVRTVPAGFLYPVATSPQNSCLQTPKDSTEDFTDFRADQELWKEEDIPEIMYVMSQPVGWLSRKELTVPPLKTYPIHGKIMRDIPILPDHISTGIEGWRLSVWYRMDPRISLTDLVDRINDPEGRDQKSTIQMRTKRFRESFPALGWVNIGAKFAEDRNSLESMLKEAGVDKALNTTRGVSWGLKYPAQGEAGGRVEIPRAKRWESSVENAPAQLPCLPSALPATDASRVSSETASSSRVSPSDSHADVVPLTSDSLGINDASCAQAVQRKRAASDSDTEEFQASKRIRRHMNERHANRAAPLLSNILPRIGSCHQRQHDQGHHVISAAIQPVQDDLGHMEGRFGGVSSEPNRDSSYPGLDGFSLLPSSASGDEISARRVSSVSEASRGLEQPLRPGCEDLNPHFGNRYLGQDFDGREIFQFGSFILRLKTPEERRDLLAVDQRLLTSFCPAGSEERAKQLEYFLDAYRARFHFEDENGSWPMQGFFPFEHNIYYPVGREEALARLGMPEDTPLDPLLGPGFLEQWRRHSIAHGWFNSY